MPSSKKPALQCNVLVVDDDEDGREIASTFLSVAGAKVSAVASADAARKALRKASFDVIVSGVSLGPGESGIDLVRSLRAHGEKARCLAVTGAVMTDQVKEIREAGFDAHLGKPYDANELVARVAELCKQS